MLVTKLITHFNFSEQSSLLVESYLSHRRQTMRVNGQTFNTCSGLIRAPQGSVLQPLLFIMFINELMAKIHEAHLFADDQIISVACMREKISNSSNTIPILNLKDISIVQFWKIKYLGVIIDNLLFYKLHTKKVMRALYPLIAIFCKQRKLLTPGLAALWYTGSMARQHYGTQA